MHESRVVGDLMSRVSAELASASGELSQIVLRIGALASVSPEALRKGVEVHAAAAWGQIPEVIVERSSDVGDAGASGVTLVSIRVED